MTDAHDAVQIAWDYQQTLTDDDPQAAYLLRLGARAVWLALIERFPEEGPR